MSASSAPTTIRAALPAVRYRHCVVLHICRCEHYFEHSQRKTLLRLEHWLTALTRRRGHVSSSSTRNAPPIVTWLLVVLGIVLIVVGVLYFTRTADQLPSFFPGHQAGSDHHHTKHGVAAVILGLIAFIGAWFSAGKKESDQLPAPPPPADRAP